MKGGAAAAAAAAIKMTMIRDVSYRLLPMIVNVLYAIVVVFGFVLTAITLHGLYPVSDPVAPVGLLDRLCFVMGVHDRVAVTVLDLDAWSSTVYTYVFHRHLNDGSFQLEEEKKETLLPGLLGDHGRPEVNLTVLHERIRNLLSVASDQQPTRFTGPFRLMRRLRQTGDYERMATPVVARVAERLAVRIRGSMLLQGLSAVVNGEFRAAFQFDPESGAAGTLDEASIDGRALQWFAVNVLTGRLQSDLWMVEDTAAIIDVGKSDANITVAINGSVDEQLVAATKQLTAFGRLVRLVTLRFRGLGLYSARRHALLLNGTVSGQLRNACINPIINAVWEWNGEQFHVRGSPEPFSQVKVARVVDGPFAGKRMDRPVANVKQCRSIMTDYLDAKISELTKHRVKKLLRDRPLFMEGLLKEKCVEMGLSGDVVLKDLLTSSKDYCAVPNADQPFACTDLAYLTSLLDHIVGGGHHLVLRSGEAVDGMTARWPLAVAFHVFHNGLQA